MSLAFASRRSERRARLEEREAAADLMARVPCADAMFDTIVIAYQKENDALALARDAQLPAVPARLIEKLNAIIYRCLIDDAAPTRNSRLMQALDAGLFLAAKSELTPELYLAMAVWAEAKAPQRARKLLGAAEGACTTRSIEASQSCLNAINQWRVLHALKSGDRQSAREALAAIRLTADADARLPSVSLEQVGSVWKLGDERQTVQEFVRWANGQLARPSLSPVQ